VPTAIIVVGASAAARCAGTESHCGFVYTLRTPSGTSHQGSCAGELATFDFAIRRGQTFEFKSVRETTGEPLLQVPLSDDPAVVAVVAVHGRGNATYRAFAVGEATLGVLGPRCPAGLVASAPTRPGRPSAPLCPVLHVRVAP
jgi:hypothetical protein